MTLSESPIELVSPDFIERRILLVRGQKVMLDSDLADLYQVLTKNLNLAVRRNGDRFPADFMFQLTDEEVRSLRLQFATSRSYGGRRYLPYVFTEQGVAMLSSVPHSKRAIVLNIAIMRTFVYLRQLLATNKELAEKIATMEKKYDGHFRAVFVAINKLLEPTKTRKRREMGFVRDKQEKKI